MVDACDYQQMRELLSRHGFRFSKAKGQNFLTRAWVPEQIAAGADLDRNCGVLEIGPGMGPLTQRLCQSAGKVVAIELDRTLEPVLKETMAGFDNFTLVFGDALRTDLAALVRAQFPGLRPVACANLPYYITTPVLTKLLEGRLFETVTVMVQKEVALRICAKPGAADYGAFTVFCNYYASPSILFDVPPDCFVPQPKVTSAVVRLDRRAAPVCEILDEDLFFRVVRGSFSMRRKTLLNGLRGTFPQLSREALLETLTACGLPETVRGETLDLAGFAAVSNQLAKRLTDV